MKHVLSYSVFENKHKGPEVQPKLVYHKSNPIFRNLIDEQGLKVMKGDSYSCHSPEKECPPAIFGYVGDPDCYDSTYDDDIWLIDTSEIPDHRWYIDLEVSGYIQSAVVTYENIPRRAIRLIYRGTGESA